MTVGLLAFGILLILVFRVWAFVVEGAHPHEFEGDQFSVERAARLARLQATWKASRHAHAGRMNRAA
jgi:hypothetical protein